nr:MAG: hypothetical protein [Bacteriophage sp.]
MLDTLSITGFPSSVPAISFASYSILALIEFISPGKNYLVKPEPALGSLIAFNANASISPSVSNAL